MSLIVVVAFCSAAAEKNLPLSLMPLAASAAFAGARSAMPAARRKIQVNSLFIARSPRLPELTIAATGRSDHRRFAESLAERGWGTSIKWGSYLTSAGWRRENG